MPAKRSFIDKLMGVSRIDNEADPYSAYSRQNRTNRPTPVTEQSDLMRRRLEFIGRTNPSVGFPPRK